MWIYPPIIGSVVVVNPESEHYRSLTEKERKLRGVIIKSLAKPYDTYEPDRRVTVEWEDGVQARIRCDNLWPVHNAHEDVYRYMLRTHEFYTGTKTYVATILDQKVIREGCTVSSESVFKKENRDKFLREHFIKLEGWKADRDLTEQEQLAYAELIIDGYDKPPSTEDSEN